MNSTNQKKYLSASRKHLWMSKEDELLKNLVKEMGPKRWDSIAKCMGNGRTASQCNKRWKWKLSPDVCTEKKRSDVEDKFIMHMHRLVGNQWTLICKYLTGRVPYDIKNRFNALVKAKANGKESVKSVSQTDLQLFVKENPHVIKTGFVSKYASETKHTTNNHSIHQKLSISSSRGTSKPYDEIGGDIYNLVRNEYFNQDNISKKIKLLHHYCADDLADQAALQAGHGCEDVTYGLVFTQICNDSHYHEHMNTIIHDCLISLTKR